MGMANAEKPCKIFGCGIYKLRNFTETIMFGESNYVRLSLLGFRLKLARSMNFVDTVWRIYSGVDVEKNLNDSSYGRKSSWDIAYQLIFYSKVVLFLIKTKFFIRLIIQFHISVYENIAIDVGWWNFIFFSNLLPPFLHHQVKRVMDVKIIVKF